MLVGLLIAGAVAGVIGLAVLLACLIGGDDDDDHRGGGTPDFAGTDISTLMAIYSGESS